MHAGASSPLPLSPPGAGVVREQAIEEGLDVILTEAGFDFRQPGCSMCLAMNADKLGAGERCASTSNRNFEGRQGAGGRTHLMSPMMAAAAAVTGTLADVRALQLPAEALRTLSADAGASRLQQKVRGAPAWAGAGCALLSPYCTHYRPAPCITISAPHSDIGPAQRSSPRLLRPRISSLADGGPSRSFSCVGFPAFPRQPPSLLHLPSPALASLSQMWGEAHESAGAIIREPKAGGGPVAATAGMPKFVNLKGVAAALPIANVDTGGHIPLLSAPCPRPSPVFRRLPCSNAESATVTAAPLGTNGRQVGRGGRSG